MKRPLQGGGSTYFHLITYPEIFGVPRPTIGEFRLRLAALPKLPLVKICSVLNAVLEMKAEPRLTFSFQAHRGLVAAYFPRGIARHILQLEHRNPPGVVFHRQQLLFVMKEALQYASDEATGEMSNEALGELFLIANDHMHFERSVDSADILDKFAFIASTFLQLREGVAANARHKILRSFQMVKASTELAEATLFFDVFGLFEWATGLNLMDFYALMFGAISRFAEFHPTKYLSDPGSYSLDDHWFSSTKIRPEAIERFFGLISGTPDYFANRLSTNTGPNDFTAFRDRPTLKASPKLELIDFSMLMEKFESGPFWAIHSKLGSKDRSAFHSFWGKLFEKYIGNILMNSADGKKNSVYVSPLFDGTDEEFIDLAVVCGQSLVLLELKGTTFTAKAKYEGDYTMLRRELESKLVESEDRPQGIRQLAKNITRAFGKARELVPGLDLTYVRTVFPVLVTRDDLGGVPGVNAFLEIRFNKLLDRKSVGTSVAPLTCMSSETIESLSPYFADTSFAQIIEAQIAANRKGLARYQTMPFFTVRNTVLAKKGERPLPSQSRNFDELVNLCRDRLGLSP